MTGDTAETYKLMLMPWQRDALLEQLDADLRKWAQPVAQQIRNQIPLPVPTKIGAVVLTTDTVGSPWVLAQHADRPWYSPATNDWAQPHQIGRVTEVLSDGVDL